MIPLAKKPVRRGKFAEIAVFLGMSVCLAAGAANADFDSGIAAFERGDYRTALGDLEPLARAGNGAAGYYVGRIFAEGRGTPADRVQAYKWFTCAVATGVSSPEIPARSARERVAAALGPDDIRRASALAQAECGAGAGAMATRKTDPMVVYRPKRDGFFETVLLFAGDLTIWGLLTVASLFDLPGLRTFVVRLYESYQVWLVVVISLIWWALLVRVMVIVASAMSSSAPNPVRGSTAPGDQPVGPIRKLYQRLFSDDNDDLSARR